MLDELTAAVKAMRAAQKSRGGVDAGHDPKAAKELRRLERLVDAKVKEAEASIKLKWRRRPSSWTATRPGDGWRG